ncbi:MAG: putative metallopeptidase [Nanoarchaeota archaeon]
MPIKYEQADDIRQIAEKIVFKLSWNHIKLDNVAFLRSRGSSSRGTIARCHALGKAMQIALSRKGFYLIEVISERFDRLSEEERTKVIIHELMHIPKTFGGGFKHHNFVNEKNVRKVYEHYKKIADLEYYGI